MSTIPCRDSNLGPRPRSERNKYDALDRSAMDPLIGIFQKTVFLEFLYFTSSCISKSYFVVNMNVHVYSKSYAIWQHNIALHLKILQYKIAQSWAWVVRADVILSISFPPDN